LCWVFFFFWDRVSWTIWLSWLQNVILLISAFSVARLQVWATGARPNWCFWAHYLSRVWESFKQTLKCDFTTESSKTTFARTLRVPVSYFTIHHQYGKIILLLHCLSISILQTACFESWGIPLEFILTPPSPW
jgi:hypothetical protein